MKILLQFLFFISFLKGFSQNEVFIDYEKDTQWIQKLSQMQGSKQNSFSFSKELFLKQSSKIPISYHPVIEYHIERYLSYKWISKIIGLFEYYRPLFESKLNEYHLPLELALLPIVESNLNPQAISQAGAMGLWQFMPQTGKQYGLVKSKNINLFFDPYASTESACQLISYLYKELNDWNLVLSAYNSGLGNVRKAIKKAQTTDYWQVRKFLPKETQAYVPTFHAIKFIYHYYNQLFQSLPSLKYHFLQTKEITIPKSTTFVSLSKELQINLETLYFINPHLTQEFIPKNSFIYILPL